MKLKKIRLSLKTEISALFVLVLSCAMIIQGAVTLRVAEHALVDSVEEHLLSIASDIGNQISAVQKKELTVLKSLSLLDEFRDEAIPLEEKQARLLAAVKRLGDRYENIGFIATDGSHITAFGARINLASRQYFIDAMNGQDVIVDPYYSDVAKMTLTTYAVPVKNDRGDIVGVLNMNIKGNDILDFCGKVDLGEGMHPSVMNCKTGAVIANLNETSKDQTDYSSLDPESDFGKMIFAIIDRKTGVSNFTEDATGMKITSSYCPIPDTDWAIMCAASYDYYYHDLERFKIIIVILLVVSILISVALSFISLSILTKTLVALRDAIADIASGNADLTQRLKKRSDNEIGDVVDSFNKFIEKLQLIMSDLKVSKENLITAGENLDVSTQETSSSITQIIANIESVHQQINNQSGSVQQTAGAVNQIASNIESLDKMIVNQSMGVSQASSAVEEMIGNINSVNRSMDKMAESFDSLASSAQSGSQLQSGVNTKIEEIREQSETLQEANLAISSIAAQTNLLAMNAAIEAAHAGDAGKGFSVVADEIRKLSETSSQQSKTIGIQLTNIRKSIEEMVDASHSSSEAFHSVASKIDETDELVRQVKAAMEEQAQGSQQINEALHSMNDSSIEVRNASREMAEGNKAILEEVKNLQDATGVMKNSMDEMSIGAKKINETGAILSDISQNMGSSIQKIGEGIDLFKV